MSAPRKYSVELQQRATRMAVDARKDPESSRGAIKRVADQLGVHPEALRTWVKQAEVDEGVVPGTTTADATRIAELERENLKARQLAGLERAKAEGKALGRSKSIDDAAVCAWRAENSASIKTTAEHFGISAASVKRACSKGE